MSECMDTIHLFYSWNKQLSREDNCLFLSFVQVGLSGSGMHKSAKVARFQTMNCVVHNLSEFKVDLSWKKETA